MKRKKGSSRSKVIFACFHIGHTYICKILRLIIYFTFNARYAQLPCIRNECRLEHALSEQIYLSLCFKNMTMTIATIQYTVALIITLIMISSKLLSMSAVLVRTRVIRKDLLIFSIKAY